MSNMVLPRREFLKGLALLACEPALRPFLAIQGDRYSNSRLGLELRVPDGWHFLSAVDYAGVRSEQRISFRSAEAEGFFSEWREQLPVVAVTKFPADYEPLNPNLMIWAEDLDDLPADDPCQILRWSLIGFRDVLRDLRVLEQPRPVQLGGRPASRALASFAYDQVAGWSIPVRAQIYVVVRKDQLHTFQLVDGFSAAEDATEDLAFIRRTVRYR